MPGRCKDASGPYLNSFLYAHPSPPNAPCHYPLLLLGDVQAALQELEAALDCKYVAAEALTALNRIYQVCMIGTQDKGSAPVYEEDLPSYKLVFYLSSITSLYITSPVYQELCVHLVVSAHCGVHVVCE
jgi:hypothetical protein